MQRPSTELPVLSFRPEPLTIHFVALRAQPMTEISVGVIPDIPFQLHPAAIGLPNPLALHTNGQYPSKTRQFPIPGLIQGPLCFDAVCNINATTDIAEELVAFAEEGGAPVEYPAVFPIVTLQPVFHFKWFAVLKRFTVRGKAVLEIFRMDTLSPLISVLLVHTASSKLEPSVVEVVTLRGCVGPPDLDRGLFHQNLVLT